jgi:hypothetical protein
MVLGPALYWATRPDKNAKLAEALRLGNIGEHLGNEDEEVEVNNPAPADSMPEIPRMEPTIRRRKPSPAPQPQNPRLYLEATVAENGGHIAHFTTKRRHPRTGRIERHKNIGQKDVAALVNKDGNHLWVSSAQ